MSLVMSWKLDKMILEGPFQPKPLNLSGWVSHLVFPMQDLECEDELFLQLPVTPQVTDELPQNPCCLHVEPWPLTHRQTHIPNTKYGDFITPAWSCSNSSNTDDNPEENRSSVGSLSPLFRSLGHPGNSQSAKLPRICKQSPALGVGETHHTCGTEVLMGYRCFRQG